METGTGREAAPLANGRYRLVSVLGEGGQATVYRAWDSRLGVWRAIKVLRPGSPRSLRERFETEARTLARLQHPNLLVVHDVGEEGERAYMVMALASESLADRLSREGPMAPASACAIAEAVAGALSVAHAAGVVHRDIKPANILANESGRPLLSDFGIARVLDERRTRTDAVMGTPLFMAPEQRGTAETADARADIYALGATLYTAMVGHEPAGPIEDLADGALAAVPAPLHEVLRKATARDPKRRYPTAEALAQALGEVLPALGEGTGWRPPSIVVDAPTEIDPQRSWSRDPGAPGPTAVPRSSADARTLVSTLSGRPARRSRWLWLGLLAGAGLLMGAALLSAGVLTTAGVVGWWATRTEEPRVGGLRRLTSFPPGVEIELFGVTRDGAEVFYLDSATALVWRHPADGNTPRARLHPEHEEPRLAGYLDEDLLGFVDDEGHLALRDLRRDLVIPFDHQGSQFELSPEGDQIGWHDGSSAFRVSVDGGPAVPLFTVPEGQIIHGMAWSPEQDRLAFVVIGEHQAGDQQVRVVVVDADGMMSSRPIYASGDIAYTDRLVPVIWPWPDALLLAEESDEGRDHLVVVPIEGGSPVHLDPLPIQVGHLSARAGTLAVLGSRPMRDTWIAQVGEGGRLLGELEMPWADEDYDSPEAWLPDGALAYQSNRFQDWRLLAQHLDSPDVRVLAERANVAVTSRGLAMLSDDGTLARSPLPDGAPWDPGPRTRFDTLSCAPDGACVAARFQGDALEFSHFAPEATQGVVFTRLPLTGQVVIALSVDGRTLALLERTTEQGLLRLCDLESHEWRELLLPDIHNPQALAWRTDGPGWWVSTAASKYASGPVLVALRPDGTHESAIPLEGWAGSLVPSPDGSRLALDLNRKDVDVWVAELAY
jgi:tRNA A-37 threonylcarbamoyl transferase component Bud32